jgi:hypothetical protein
MDNIIKFPVKTVKDKTLLEKTIQRLLSQENQCDPKTRNEITKRILAVQETYHYEFSSSFSLPFPESATPEEKEQLQIFVEQRFKEMEISFKEHLEALLIARLNVDIKLYFFERGDIRS